METMYKIVVKKMGYNCAILLEKTFFDFESAVAMVEHYKKSDSPRSQSMTEYIIVEC